MADASVTRLAAIPARPITPNAHPASPIGSAHPVASAHIPAVPPRRELWAALGLGLMALAGLGLFVFAPLSVSASLALAVALPLALAFACNSRLALMTSQIATAIALGWAAQALYSGQTRLDLTPALLTGPALLSLQTWQAARLRAPLATGLAAALPAAWMATLALALQVPLAAALGGLALLGWVQARSAKAAEDEAGYGARLHYIAGFAVAALGGLALARLWLLSPAPVIAPAPDPVWVAVLAAAALAATIAGAIRWKHRRTTLLTWAGLSGLALIVPVLAAFPDLAISWGGGAHLDALTYPAVLICAGTLAAALGLVVNAARRASLALGCTGLVTAALAVLTILHPDIVSVEAGLVFAAGTIAGLAVLATLSGWRTEI